MAGTATEATGTSNQSQQTPAESPEIVAARAKANDAGFARNRAEATYNALKKEKGADSPEAQAAKKTLEAAQAEVEKSQAELRTALKLPTKKAPAPAPKAKEDKEAKAPAKAAPEEPHPAPAELPRGAYLERIEVKSEVHELLKVLPDKDRGRFQRRLQRLIQELKTDPKNLEYYRKQLQNNGEMLKVFQAPVRGEMMTSRAQLFERVLPAKLKQSE